MSSINFGNVYLLLIAVPIVVLVSIPFAIAIRRNNVNGHNVASLALHVVMAVLIAFSAAGTSVLTVVTQTQVYVVADVSYSANSSLDTVDEYIQTVKKNLPRNSQMGIICFGKDFEVLTEMGGQIKSVKTSGVDQSETNVAAALEYVGRQFKEVDGAIKRVVLITDGKQTDTRDENAMKRAVENLTEDGVIVDAMFLDSNLKEDSAEVQISEAAYTGVTYLNRSEKATVQISCKTKMSATVCLYKNGELLSDRTKVVNLPIESGGVSFDLDTNEEGTFEYEIRVVEAEGDASAFNNSCFFTQRVTSTVSVMLIAQTQDEIDAAKSIYGESTNITSFCLDKLRAANPDGAIDIPYTVEALCEYDEIVLSNADITKFNHFSTFVDSLDIFVGQFGKSLVTIGDLGIQNKRESEEETEALKKLDLILPVNYGSNNDHKLYTIVIDASYSMGKLDKWERAKSAAQNIVSFLSDDDYVCVVAFNGDITYLQRPTKASSRDKIIEDISNLSLANGTIVGLGLREAYKQFLAYTGYSERQVMLITDGLDYAAASEEDGDFNPKTLATEMFKEGITVSVLDVGRGATAPGSDNYELYNQTVADLMTIAKNGGGKYRLVDTDQLLKEEIFGEIASEVNQTVKDSNSSITVNRRFDDTVKDIDFGNSYISTFLTSSTKGRATEVLSVSYKSGGLSVSTSLYSYWNYGSGKGRVASFSSAICGTWIRGFTGNQEAYRSFFANLIECSIPAEKSDYPYTVSVQSYGTYARVEVVPATPHADAVAEIEITLPDGTTLANSLLVSNTTYYYEFATSQAGTYGMKINYAYNNNDYTAETNYTLSYKPEYDAFVSFDASALRKAVGSDRVTTDGTIQIVNDDKNVTTYEMSIVPAFLIACAVLFIADIVVRKLKWNDIKSLFKKVN